MKNQKIWYKLDAFAKTYSSIISEGRTTCFRLSVLLYEDIEVEILKKAAEDLQKKYPFYNSELKKGIFWNYLQQKNTPLQVVPEIAYPCTEIKKKNPLRILYYKKKISIEIAHFLTDGGGAAAFFRDLIEKYLDLKYFKSEEKLENKDKKQIINYNCFTGEPINIENHSSGENKWMAKKDVERLEIEKKEDVKEKIGKIAVMMTEKEMEDYKKNRGMETKEITNPSNEKKLYIIPVPYYNISDLKITKEIEKKFVPMKEKEKSQEIEKSKGQGIGD